MNDWEEIEGRCERVQDFLIVQNKHPLLGGAAGQHVWVTIVQVWDSTQTVKAWFSLDSDSGYREALAYLGIKPIDPLGNFNRRR